MQKDKTRIVYLVNLEEKYGKVFPYNYHLLKEINKKEANKDD